MRHIYIHAGLIILLIQKEAWVGYSINFLDNEYEYFKYRT